MARNRKDSGLHRIVVAIVQHCKLTLDIHLLDLSPSSCPSTGPAERPASCLKHGQDEGRGPRRQATFKRSNGRGRPSRLDRQTPVKEACVPAWFARALRRFRQLLIETARQASGYTTTQEHPSRFQLRLGLAGSCCPCRYSHVCAARTRAASVYMRLPRPRRAMTPLPRPRFPIRLSAATIAS